MPTTSTKSFILVSKLQNYNSLVGIERTNEKLRVYRSPITLEYHICVDAETQYGDWINVTPYTKLYKHHPMYYIIINNIRTAFVKRDTIQYTVTHGPTNFKIDFKLDSLIRQDKPALCIALQSFNRDKTALQATVQITDMSSDIIKLIKNYCS